MRSLLYLVCILSWATLAVLLWTGRLQQLPARVGVQDDITAIANNLNDCVSNTGEKREVRPR